jgi:lipopolysaccharide transport system ATP-binding protein
MSSDDVVIRVANLGKCYQIYEKPQHRLWQGLFRGKKKFYKEFWAVKDVSFEVRRGESIGIIGRNGSGKSTLLQMIAGTLTPTLGTVETQGRVAALLELGAGFNPEFTGRENAKLNAALLGLNNEAIEAQIEDIAAFADIGEFFDQPVKIYSSGMYVRLAFAVSVFARPEVLVVDEALAVGDMSFQFKCNERLQRLIDSGTTLLFVSHDVGMVKSFCDRAILLDRGQLIASGSSAEVTETYIMNMRGQQMAAAKASIAPKARIGETGRFAFGTKQGRIVAAHFDATGQAGGSFWTGDTISVTIDVEHSETVMHPSLALIVQDRKMLMLAGQYAALKGGESRDGLFRYRVNCRFRAPFAPGEYFITLRLEDRLSERVMSPVDKQVGALSFEMLSKESANSLGVLDVDMEFDVSNVAHELVLP